jgi:hypothetical protein
VTGTLAILLATVAGLVVGERRRMIWALALPYLAIAGFQTWGLWSGRGDNPPSTVNSFPGAISYYVVQLLIFGLAFAVANQLRLRRVAKSAPSADSRRQLRTAVVINLVISAVLVGLWQLHRDFFASANVPTHSTSSGPPVLGVLGMGALVASFIALMAMAGWRRFVSRGAVPAGV